MFFSSFTYKLSQSAISAHSIACHRQYSNKFLLLSRSLHSNMCTKKTAAVFLAPGFEEIEFTTTVDVLRRGGVDVVIVGTEDCKPVCGSRQIQILPDTELCRVDEPYDALVLPGGLNGAKALAYSEPVGALLREQERCCRIIAAICAAPTALKAHGIGKGRKLTSYPAMEQEMCKGGDYTYCYDEVVVDGPLITSRGPATAMKFALTILKELVDDAKACEVAKAMLCM